MPFLPLIFSAFNFVKNSWVGKAIAILLFLLGGWMLAKRSGRKQAEAKQEKANLKNYVDIQQRVDDAKEKAAREVGALDPDDLDDELRKFPGAFRE